MIRSVIRAEPFIQVCRDHIERLPSLVDADDAARARSLAEAIEEELRSDLGAYRPRLALTHLLERVGRVIALRTRDVPDVITRHEALMLHELMADLEALAPLGGTRLRFFAREPTSALEDGTWRLRYAHHDDAARPDEPVTLDLAVWSPRSRDVDVTLPFVLGRLAHLLGELPECDQPGAHLVIEHRESRRAYFAGIVEATELFVFPCEGTGVNDANEGMAAASWLRDALLADTQVADTTMLGRTREGVRYRTGVRGGQPFHEALDDDAPFPPWFGVER